MLSFKPSAAFEQAAAFLSNTSNLADISDSMKLELYGLYKVVTVAAEPPPSGPSIFYFTERAKWDAWKMARATWTGNQAGAEARYIEIAKSLGWAATCAESAPTNAAPSSRSDITVEELLEDGEGNSLSRGSSGMGIAVSTMRNPVQSCAGTKDGYMLHKLAVEGDVEGMQKLLKERHNTSLDELDEYGFTALHLACDRGHVKMVELLLKNGARDDIRDPDGFTALQLSQEAGHEDIINLLQNK